MYGNQDLKKKKKKKKKQYLTELLSHLQLAAREHRYFFSSRSGIDRVATVREKYLENEIFSRSGKSQGILWMVREI